MNTNRLPTAPGSPDRNNLKQRFQNVRNLSLSLADGLSDADATVQSMLDASPAKWHLAHTTWFFEAVVLDAYLSDYTHFDGAYSYLFNSYYEALGPRHARPNRGMLTRPALSRVLEYRAHVDTHVSRLLEQSKIPSEALDLIELGLNHEQQHQELLLTDLLHLFSQNPLNPEYRAPVPLSFSDQEPAEPDWQHFAGGIHKIGHDASSFSFDCEGPVHDTLLQPFELATRPVSIGEWMCFIEEGGYDNPLHWLSDGWATVQSEDWSSPLYWEKRDNQWWTMTLHGFQPVNSAAPVCHISFFEADAYARWAGCRLPTEFEWEVASHSVSKKGHFADQALYRPLPATDKGAGLKQMFGDVWEWTSSPYMAYPGFKPIEGVAAEYNGKFMSGQYVLRGGSCVTPADHIRSTYRNFFYPHQKWQFTGLRLARNTTPS